MPKKLCRRLKLYYHTAKYLKFTQWISLIKQALPKTPPIPPAKDGDVSIIRYKSWVQGVATPGRFDSPSSFTFLNESKQVELDSSWGVKNGTALWQFNLHYFHFILQPSCSEESGLELIRSWLKVPTSSIAWHPYPTSLRIVNWIRFHNEVAALPQAAVNSLQSQTEHLFRNLESHLLANHYLANAKALLFAATHLDCAESEKWLAKGLSILSEQLDEQFLADGGHFERSPMYHRVLTLDLLDLLNLLNLKHTEDTSKLISKLPSKISLALDWMLALTHTGPTFPLFGDSAYGIAPEDQDILDYAQRLGLEIPDKSTKALLILPDSGFAICNRDQLRLIADIGNIVADYQPGHAHADLLGFEASLAGKRIFVDSGVDRYEPGSERLRQRSSAAHNTLTIDDQNSNEVWSSFRVARRGRVKSLSTEVTVDKTTIECAHDGFRNQKLAELHKRRWTLEDQRITIRDEVELTQPRKISAHYIIHPDFKVEIHSEGFIVINRKSYDTSHVASISYSNSNTVAKLTPVQVCLEFGRSETGTQVSLVTHASENFDLSVQIDFSQDET